MLYFDPFTRDCFCRLDAVRASHCVSIYLPTHTVSRETEQDRILFRNLVREAIGQLSAAGADKQLVSAVEAGLQNLADDRMFWNHAGNGLAVLATPESVEAYRLPRTVSAEVEVSDRFHLKPLIPLLAFPHTAFILDITQAQVRLWSVSEGRMDEIAVPDMPTSFDEALEQRIGDGERANMRQDEHRKVRQRQFVSAIEQALRPVLRGAKTPMVLAGVETILNFYREVDTYPHTMSEAILGNQEHRRQDELAAEARAIVSRRFESEVQSRLERAEALRQERRSSTDLMEIALAAREGRVESLIVDVEREIYGSLERGIGAVRPGAEPRAASYDVLDELVGLTLRQGGEVLAVRKDKLPDRAGATAIFRYAA